MDSNEERAHDLYWCMLYLRGLCLRKGHANLRGPSPSTWDSKSDVGRFGCLRLPSSDKLSSSSSWFLCFWNAFCDDACWVKILPSVNESEVLCASVPPARWEKPALSLGLKISQDLCMIWLNIDCFEGSGARPSSNGGNVVLVSLPHGLPAQPSSSDVVSSWLEYGLASPMNVSGKLAFGSNLDVWEPADSMIASELSVLCRKFLTVSSSTPTWLRRVRNCWFSLATRRAASCISAEYSIHCNSH